MKKLFIASLVLAASTTQSFAYSTATTAEIEKIQSTACLDDIQSVLVTVSSPIKLSLAAAALNPLLAVYTAPTVYMASSDARKAILANLKLYKSLLVEIRDNLKMKVSNEDNYAVINMLLDRHEDDTVLGIAVGKTVVECIRPHLTFKGTPTQQYARVIVALGRIESIRKAVE